MARIHRIYKKGLIDPDNHTVPQPDILECEVKWGSVTTNKASGGDGIPAVTMSGNLENSAVATELEKVTFYSNPQNRQFQRMPRLLKIEFVSQASKVMLKSIQARL